ncbi:hypothetical protein F8M41_026476 [Gigaspora margarita]|uniref:Uncharacterized protein n=1 Tax=Gigaspora margarita TaxID=4874 RepID=A0A8H3XJ94_GIGMA|nr:hypothetical protein F8M41_026476 [Gigaspora margarita]
MSLIRPLQPLYSNDVLDAKNKSDVRTEVKKVKWKAFRHYQSLAKKDHTCELDDPYDASWYCRKGGKLERVGERRPQSYKTRRKVSTNYKKIVSEMESEEFDQGKKEKVEDVYTKSREIVNSKALEFFLKIIEKYSHLMPSQFYPQRIQEVEAMYSEVDQRNRLNKRGNYWNECRARIRRVSLGWDQEFDSEILVKEELEKDKNPIFKSAKEFREEPQL